MIILIESSNALKRSLNTIFSDINAGFAYTIKYVFSVQKRREDCTNIYVYLTQQFNRLQSIHCAPATQQYVMHAFSKLLSRSVNFLKVQILNTQVLRGATVALLVT